MKTIVIILAVAVTSAYGQQSAQERVATLRAQLAEIQTQQADLQTRLAQLDEDLKPENIERNLAGVGSTHPEQLRDERRRQLEIQRKGLQAQLDSVTASRTRLESAVASAETEAYRQSAQPTVNTVSVSDAPASKQVPTNTNVTRHSRRQTPRLKKRRS